MQKKKKKKKICSRREYNDVDTAIECGGGNKKGIIEK
jgi:hypothetical protein